MAAQQIFRRWAAVSRALFFLQPAALSVMHSTCSNSSASLLTDILDYLLPDFLFLVMAGQVPGCSAGRHLGPLHFLLQPSADDTQSTTNCSSTHNTLSYHIVRKQYERAVMFQGEVHVSLNLTECSNVDGKYDLYERLTRSKWSRYTCACSLLSCTISQRYEIKRSSDSLALLDTSLI